MKIQVLIAFVFLITAYQVNAGAIREGEGDQAMKRMQFMLKQITKEKAILEQDKLTLEKELADVSKELEEAKETIVDNELAIQKLEAKVAGLVSTVEKRDNKIERREKQLREVIAKYQDAQLLIKQLNIDKEELQYTVEQKNAELDDYDNKNLKLYEANLELMELYENKSSLDALLQKDGITGLKQVEIENILQEYRIKSDDNRTNRQNSDQTSLEN